MTCSTCKFWTGNRTEPQAGQCRRFPPVTAGNALMRMVSVGNPQGQPQPVPIFAVAETAGDFWCGEYASAIVQ